MPDDAASHAIRQIRTLYGVGSVGGLSDSQLLERFLNHVGREREDAFAALVDRHGPMVLRVCRRVLSGSADSEDAFQAVFLVLARKAASVRRRESLKSWLYAVAVRTATEARNRVARQRATEAAAMNESKVRPAPDEGLPEALALLDQEIQRLPSRFRDPLLLCELEGTSRHDAARQLGLAEGTLSSRLARGRSLLRARLARRGVALGAGTLAAVGSMSAGAELPEPLAQTTVRLALVYAAPGVSTGAVPAAVASLADSVQELISMARMKSILFAAGAAGAGVLMAACLAWAIAPQSPAPRAAGKADVPATEKPEDKAPAPNAAAARGIVMDETGRPVAGAEVLADAYNPDEVRGTTAVDGTFVLRVPRPFLNRLALLARTTDGSRLGVFQYAFDPKEPAPRAHIVVKPGHDVVARVVDGRKAAVAGAAVEAAGDFAIVADAHTGPDGLARLRVPADARVEWIFTLKPGLGFDYAEFGPVNEQGQPRGGAPAGELPPLVALALDSSRAVQIKAVDPGGAPLPGVSFSPWLLSRPGRRTRVNTSSRILNETTGPDGVATFDWLPPAKNHVFWPRDNRYARRRVVAKEDQTGPVTAKLNRCERIRGRVVYSDGSPAPGIAVTALGSGQGIDQQHAWARTAADGTYAMDVSARDAYAVYVENKDWVAPTRLDVVVRDGKPVDGVDFRLSRGTILRGKVTVGPDRRAVAEQYIWLNEKGEPAPEEFREKGDTLAYEVRRQIGTWTDAGGRYSFRIGPGKFTLVGPPHTGNSTLVVKDEPEIVRDLDMARPEMGPLSGRVVVASDPARGVAGATIEIVAAKMASGRDITATTDANGRFQVQRHLDPSVVFTKSADGSLGAIVELGAEDPDMVIALAPTATATGLLHDEQGKPAAKQALEYCGRRVYLDPERLTFRRCFVPAITTDGEGRFTLPSLVVGQHYDIVVWRESGFLFAGEVKPEQPGPIDLGTLRAGAYHPPSHQNADEGPSFRKDAPDAGAVAPPLDAMTLDGKHLSLEDFRGKYVLLDFWATWCGPCISEIPYIQRIADDFARDDRLAIISLSVDDAVAEPKAFQERRKLPWAQAFLDGGLHGPTPGAFGVRAIPALVLIGPDGRIIARGMRGDEIKDAVAKALGGGR